MRLRSWLSPSKPPPTQAALVHCGAPPTKKSIMFVSFSASSDRLFSFEERLPGRAMPILKLATPPDQDVTSPLKSVGHHGRVLAIRRKQDLKLELVAARARLSRQKVRCGRATAYPSSWNPPTVKLAEATELWLLERTRKLPSVVSVGSSSTLPRVASVSRNSCFSSSAEASSASAALAPGPEALRVRQVLPTEQQACAAVDGREACAENRALKTAGSSGS